MKTDHVIDTCCLINILASGRAREILMPSYAFYIGKRAAKESLYLNEYNEENANRIGKTPVDLKPLITAESLVLCKLETEEEHERYIDFATQLDGGESEVLALGLSRNWTVVTDDRKAVRIAGEHGIKTISTLQIVMHWAKKNRIGKKEFREIMAMIQHLASFAPSPNSPGYDEWERHYK